MFINAHQTYYDNALLAPFFSRGFGMRLMSVLYLAIKEKAPIGISEAHDLMTPPKPQYSSFRQFIHDLESLGLVSLNENEDGGRRKVITLSYKALTEIERIEKALFEQTLIERAGMS